MQAVNDHLLLEQLKKEENASFELVYKYYFPLIASYVKQNSGNTEEAEDLFQEAIVVLLHKVRQPEFILTSSLKTFLFAIAKNLWLKKLRDVKLVAVEEIEFYQKDSDSFFVEIKTEKTQDEMVSSWLGKITKRCQYILNAIFFYNVPMKNLMSKMGWKNKHTAANQQYKCIQQIKREKEKEA